MNCFVNKKNLAREFVNKYANNYDKKIFLYGAGHASEYYFKYLTERQVEVEAFVDKKKKGTYNNIFIYTIEEIKQKYDIENVVFVISAPSLVREIKTQLLNYVNVEQIYYFDVELFQYYGSSYETYKNFILNSMDELAEIYANLFDEYSKRTMLKVIEGRLTSDLDIISDIWQDEQYFATDVVNFGEDEVIIECGSSDGKTLRKLCDKLKNKYSHIYCFEPDSQCKDVLRNVIKNINGSGIITYFDKGTYKETTTLSFFSDSLSSGLSKVDETGKNKIEVVALDEIISEKVSYIKMDIEGAELDTLKGAKRIISEDKPKLAVCIYHKDTDIIDIMKYLQVLNPLYKFYMRHHNCNMTETVLYAV